MFGVSYQLVRLVALPACSHIPLACVQDRNLWQSLLKNNLCPSVNCHLPGKDKPSNPDVSDPNVLVDHWWLGLCHLSLCPEAGGQTQPRTWHAAFYGTRFCDPDTLGATFSLCLTQFWQIQWSHSSVTRTHQWWSPPSSSSALHCPPLWVSLHHPDGGYSTPSTPNRQTCSSRKALFLLWKHCVRIHEAEWGACCSLFITTKPAFTFELFQAKW